MPAGMRPRLMRTAALRQKRPPVMTAVGMSAEALAEFKAARADMARLGNLFKVWLEHGSGAFVGKNGAPLTIHRGAMGVERIGVRDVLEAMEKVAKVMQGAVEERAQLLSCKP